MAVIDLHTGTDAALYVLCKFAHGFMRHRTPFAASQRSFGIIHISARALAFFPKGQRFLNRALSR